MMTREKILKDLQEKFKSDIIDVFDKSPKRVYIGIRPESLRKVAEYVVGILNARFNIATGLDARRHIEILYHFTLEDINLLVSFRVKLDRTSPKADSLTDILEGANWIEREIHEMLGVDFRGHPDLRKLLLSDDWPEGVCPLKADYKEWDKKAIRDRGI